MTIKCPIEIKSGKGHVNLYFHELPIKLKEYEARLLSDWLDQSLESSVAFLFKIALSNVEIEGRNYNNHLDFIMFFHSDEEMNVRTLNVSKKDAPLIVKKLHRAMKASFAS